SILVSGGKWPEAERLLRESFEQRVKKYGMDKVETIACLNNLSHTLLLQGRPEEAEKLLQKGLDVMLGSHGERHIRTVHLQHLRTRILLAENRFEEAEKLGQKVLALRRELLPAGNEEIGRTLAVLGQVLVKRGRPAEAEPLLLEASKLLRKDYANINVLIADV